jgi:ribonuclease I
MPGTQENAILRISVEDLKALPQIKDAVDYFDLMRETFKAVKLPPDFKYSETQAEKLGRMQFGFLDTSNKTGKKRMYATVRNGYAIMFTLTYKADEDLATMKNVLAQGNFKLK